MTLARLLAAASSRAAAIVICRRSASIRDSSLIAPIRPPAHSAAGRDPCLRMVCCRSEQEGCLGRVYRTRDVQPTPWTVNRRSARGETLRDGRQTGDCGLESVEAPLEGLEPRGGGRRGGPAA